MNDYLVGIKLTKYIDEQYVRDRDETIRASSEKEAIESWKIRRTGWLRDDEHKFIHIFKVSEPEGYCRAAEDIIANGR
jgi:hypothetical protein